MLEVEVPSQSTPGGWKTWRKLARKLVRRKVEPAEVRWRDEIDGQETLLSGTGASIDALERCLESNPDLPRPRVPPRFLDLARPAAHHSDPERWQLLYRVLWRIVSGERNLMDLETDSDVDDLRSMSKAVRRDAHKMKAFVRFREVGNEEGEEKFAAWHQPDHRVVPFVAPFFKDRFRSMHWTVLTPHRSVTWDRDSLQFGPGVQRSEAPSEDELEGIWTTYYKSIFNPARIKLDAMTAEMPQKHWSTMPETEAIQDLLRDANSDVSKMMRHAPEQADVPEDASLSELEQACQTCRACERCASATQAVFGEGPADADIVLVGEQPGDQEDKQGRPFVGPAGEVLNRALELAELDRESLYVTNAVKHFGYASEGGQRIHESPDRYITEICKPWLDAELAEISAQIVVGLGRTASQVLTGRKVAVSRERGEILRGGQYADAILPTYHPAAILRTPDDEAKRSRFKDLVRDLDSARRRLDG